MEELSLDHWGWGEIGVDSVDDFKLRQFRLKSIILQSLILAQEQTWKSGWEFCDMFCESEFAWSVISTLPMGGCRVVWILSVTKKLIL